MEIDGVKYSQEEFEDAIRKDRERQTATNQSIADLRDYIEKNVEVDDDGLVHLPESLVSDQELSTKLRRDIFLSLNALGVERLSDEVAPFNIILCLAEAVNPPAPEAGE